MAHAHPYEDIELNAWPDWFYGENYGFGPEYQLTGVEFSNDKPDTSSLTDAEQYMVCGGRDPQSGRIFLPWVNEVVSFTCAYYMLTHEMPQRLDDGIIDRLRQQGQGDYPEAILERIKSPITGNYVNLNSLDFAAGQVFMKPLSMAEMQRLASVDSHYQEIWFDHTWYNPDTGELEGSKLLTPVFYIRVYGRNQVIYESIYYLWRADSDEL